MVKGLVGDGTSGLPGDTHRSRSGNLSSHVRAPQSAWGTSASQLLATRNSPPPYCSMGLQVKTLVNEGPLQETRGLLARQGARKGTGEGTEKFGLGIVYDQQLSGFLFGDKRGKGGLEPLLVVLRAES